MSNGEKIMKSKTIGIIVVIAIVAVIAGYFIGRSAVPTPPPTTTSPPTTPPAKKFKAAIILPGTIQDNGWNTMGYFGITEVGRELKIETSYSEWVSVPDADRVAREYIAAGYNIIYFHGGEYVSVVEKLAPEYPNVTFVMHSVGYVEGLPSNIWNIGRKFYLSYYPAGYLAGKLTKTNKIGFIGGIDFPGAIAALNAFYLGVNTSNPGVKLYWTFVGTFDDPTKAREAAEAQIDEGVDVIMAYVDLGVYGIVQAAQACERHIWLIGVDIDKYGVDPERFVTTVVADFGKLYTQIAKEVIENGKLGGYIELKPPETLYLAPFHGLIPDDLANEVLKVQEDVGTGKMSVPEITDKVIVP